MHKLNLLLALFLYCLLCLPSFAKRGVNSKGGDSDILTIDLNDDKNGPHLSLIIPTGWRGQNLVNKDDIYTEEFYPPMQNKLWATEMFRLEVYKKYYPNNYDFLLKSLEAIKAHLKSKQQVISFSDVVKHEEAGRKSVEIMTESYMPGSKSKKSLSLTKIITTGNDLYNNIGLVNLTSVYLSLETKEDLERAKTNLELFRKSFREMNFYNWPQKPKLVFETKVVNVSKKKSGPKVSIPLPKNWIVNNIVDNSINYIYDVCPELNNKPCCVESLSIQVHKTPPKDTWEALNERFSGVKDMVSVMQKGMVLSKPIQYQQNNLKTLEYFGDFQSPDSTNRVLTLNKIISTGGNPQNKLGFISLIKVTSGYEHNDIEALKSELEIYKNKFREIKLVDWNKQ